MEIKNNKEGKSEINKNNSYYNEKNNDILDDDNQELQNMKDGLGNEDLRDDDFQNPNDEEDEDAYSDHDIDQI